jgi:hypothetical protein
MGSKVGGGFAEAEKALGNDPDEEAAGLQEGTGTLEPLVFKTAGAAGRLFVVVILVLGGIDVEEVVTILGAEGEGFTIGCLPVSVKGVG